MGALCRHRNRCRSAWNGNGILITSERPRYYWLEAAKSKHNLRSGCSRNRTEPSAKESRRWPRSLSFQISVKEVRGGAVSPDPVLPHQEIVDFIGKDNFFENYMLLPQPLRQIYSLPERNIAVIISVN